MLSETPAKTSQDVKQPKKVTFRNQEEEESKDGP